MTAARPLITTDSVGGVWQYSVDLARELAAGGSAPVLAHLGPSPSDELRGAVAEIAGATFVETGLPLDWLCSGPEAVLAAGRAVAELASDLDADIVQLNMPSLGAEARFDAPVVAVSHGCIATWWAAARSAPLPADYRWHERLMARGYVRADRVVAPTAAYGAVVARHYGLKAPPETVHNGRLALAACQPMASYDFAFTAGRLWDPVKNAAVLDRVAALLTIPFHAAGAATGPHGEQFEPRDLHPLGHLDEAALGAWLARRPVFVSAARFEPFGLAVLEAAAAGCPLVLADIPTFRELWDGAAMFVPVDDALGYTRAVEAIIGDEEQRRGLGEAAEERSRRYRPAATAAAMSRLYAQLQRPSRVAA